MFGKHMLETASRDRIKELHLGRLKHTVERLYHQVKMVHERLGPFNPKPKVIKSPFTGKDDVRDNYPFGPSAVPQSVDGCHGPAGLSCRCTSDDVAQVAFGYGLFAGEFGLHHALLQLGCSGMPASSGNTEADHRPRCVRGTYP